MRLANLLCVLVLTTAAQAQITNGSFESGMTGWTFTDATSNFFALGVYPAGAGTGAFGLFTSAPTDGTMSAYHGWDGAGPADVIIEQDAFVDNTHLEFDWRAGYDLVLACTGCANRDFRVDIEPAGGGPVLLSQLIYTATAGTIVGDTGGQTGCVDVTAFAGTTVRVKFIWNVPETFTGPAAAELDFVRFGPGANCGAVPVVDYPGTGDDLELRSSTYAFGTPVAPSTGALADVKVATAGDVLELQVISPGGAYDTLPFILLMQLFPTGTPPTSPLPGVHIDLGLPFIVFGQGATPLPFGNTILTGTGTTYAFTVPPGLGSTSALIQCAVVSPAGTYNNGVFATGDGHEIQF